ncbi:MAG: ATP synthase subunit I [Desulfopila sp.]
MSKNIISLQKMQLICIVYLAVLTAGSWWLFSWTVSWSILVGGIIAIASFTASGRDLNRLLDTVAASPDRSEKMARTRFGKSGFLLRFWMRFIVIGAVVLLLIRYSAINTIGLILGLSTIVFAVTFTAVEIVRHYYFCGRR